MRLEKLTADLYRQLLGYEELSFLRDGTSDETINLLCDNELSWASLSASGEVCAAFGFVEIHPQRASLWVLFRQAPSNEIAGSVKQLTRMIRESSYKRIEFFAIDGFDLAVRFVKLMGFQCEHPYKPFYFPDGRAAAEWVLLR